MSSVNNLQAALVVYIDAEIKSWVLSSRAVGGIKELFFKILAGSLELDRQEFGLVAEYYVGIKC